MTKSEIKKRITFLREHITFDASELDVVVSRQPAAFMDAATVTAHATSIRDAAKDALATITASSSLKARGSGDKMTEAKIAAMVATDTEVLDAKDELRETTLLMNEAIAVRDAYAQRNYMLRDMVLLHQSGMNAGDSTYEDSRNRMADARRKAA